jgi:hypothetical protein
MAAFTFVEAVIVIYSGVFKPKKMQKKNEKH